MPICADSRISARRLQPLLVNLGRNILLRRPPHFRPLVAALFMSRATDLICCASSAAASCTLSASDGVKSRRPVAMKDEMVFGIRHGSSRKTAKYFCMAARVSACSCGVSFAHIAFADASPPAGTACWAPARATPPFYSERKASNELEHSLGDSRPGSFRPKKRCRPA